MFSTMPSVGILSFWYMRTARRLSESETCCGVVTTIAPAAGSIVVTTPQQVSLADSRRAVRMYQKLNIPTLGLVENMSFYECTNCHHQADIFGHGGGEQVAQQLEVPFLGRLPLYQPIRVGSDRGIPLVIAEPDSAGTAAFMHLAEEVMSQLAISAHQAIVANKGKIPLIQVK